MRACYASATEEELTLPMSAENLATVRELSDWNSAASKKKSAWKKAWEATAVAVEAGQTVVVKTAGKAKAKAPPAQPQNMGEPVSTSLPCLWQ